jgi:hypothetical protein
MEPIRSGRLERERNTVSAMISMHCQGKHGSPARQLCEGCTRLHDYAMGRVAACHYGDEKPTCRRCPVHCYKPEKREQIRAVMRFAGPRMLFKHPRLAIRHLLDGAKKSPKN